jgi:hypothetical protein
MGFFKFCRRKQNLESKWKAPEYLDGLRLRLDFSCREPWESEQMCLFGVAYKDKPIFYAQGWFPYLLDSRAALTDIFQVTKHDKYVFYKLSEKEARKCTKRLIEEINWKWFGDNLSNFRPPTGPEGMLPISKAWKRIHILYDGYCEAKANKMNFMLLLPQHSTEGTILYTMQELVQSMVQVSMGWTGGLEADARQVKILKKIVSGSMVLRADC